MSAGRDDNPDLSGASRAAPPLGQEDQARADFYALIARLLLAAPDAALLSALAAADTLAAEQADNPLETGWEQLLLASGVTDPAAVQEEYDGLFVSIGTPPVNPYGSYYLSGFMMEKPLAALRGDLAQLGLARREGTGELEDHLGALCETMRILICGAASLPRRTVAQQKVFFEKHIAPWYPRCLNDIRRAEGANYYRRVADFAEAFLDVEREAFEIEGLCADACELDQ